MPSIAQLVAIAAIAAVCSLTVAGVLILLGFGEHAPFAAAVSASTSAAVGCISAANTRRATDA